MSKTGFWTAVATLKDQCGGGCGFDATLKLLLLNMFHVEPSMIATTSTSRSDVGEIQHPCSRCGEREARTGQRYCLQCHTEASRIYRQRRKKELQDLRSALDQFTGNNKVTRRKFEEQVGDPHVIITSQEGDKFHDFSGVVLGYLPEDKLSVLDSSGNVRSVPLSRAAPDVNKWHIQG